MTQLTIFLPESAQAYIDEQVANGSYVSADVLLADLIGTPSKIESQYPAPIDHPAK
jgi:hypothetical protein